MDTLLILLSVLGNDLASGFVVPNPIMVEKPIKTNNTLEMEKEYPDIFPSSVVTRSGSKRRQTLDDNEEGLDSISELFNDSLKLQVSGQLIQKSPISDDDFQRAQQEMIP